MKFGRFSYLVLVAVLAISIYSCKDKDENPKPATETGPGKGGNIIYRITPIHDGVYIDSCKVYIKYGAELQPEMTNMYDDSVICERDPLTDKPIGPFYELKKGTYFFYASGWDLVRSQRVSGTRVHTATKDGETINMELQVFAE